MHIPPYPNVAAGVQKQLTNLSFSLSLFLHLKLVYIYIRVDEIYGYIRTYGIQPELSFERKTILKPLKQVENNKEEIKARRKALARIICMPP